MSTVFDISDVLSALDYWMENRELYQTDPELTLKFVDQLKRMELWFVGKVYVDNSRFMHKMLDLCQKGPQSDVRKLMAFARYSFRQLGPERFEDCILRSCLTPEDKKMVISFFRIGEIDHVSTLADGMSTVADEKSGATCCCPMPGNVNNKPFSRSSQIEGLGVIESSN